MCGLEEYGPTTGHFLNLNNNDKESFKKVACYKKNVSYLSLILANDGVPNGNTCMWSVLGSPPSCCLGTAGKKLSSPGTLRHSREVPTCGIDISKLSRFTERSIFFSESHLVSGRNVVASRSRSITHSLYTLFTCVVGLKLLVQRERFESLL